MKLLILLAAFLLTGCSVEVAHETQSKARTDSISTSDRSKTAVAVGILEEQSPESNQTDSATSQTTVNVVVPKTSHEVVNSPPPPVRSPEPTIQFSGTSNTVVFGDVHLHHHEHLHIHETPKPTPVRVEVRVKTDDRDRIGEREKRRRMVEKRILEAFGR